MKKICTKCRKNRLSKFFKKDIRYAKGLFCWCMDCESSYSKSEDVKKRRCVRYVKWISIPKNRRKEERRAKRRRKAPGYKRNLKDLDYKRKYGITLSNFEKKVKRQKDRCKLCGRKRRLCVDHDHKTKKFRGAVCWPCNTLMGHLEQSPGLLKKMANYLKEVL